MDDINTGDIIVDIPPNRVKFFGTTGKMLLPSPATVEALLKQVPETKLISTDLLRQKLTKQFNVQGTCPVTTKKALQTIADQAGQANENVAYWRVVNQNGGLIAGIADQEQRLRQEGFMIEANGKTAKVQNFRASLVQLDS